MIELRRPTIEETLYGLAIALALFVRLLHLGAAPLSELEATWALQALGITNSWHASVAPASPLLLGPMPAYTLLTGVLFALFGSSETIARLLPCLAGSLLAASPLLFRSRLGRPAAVILAFGLAIDPGLVAISRLVGSPILALVCTILALGFWDNRRNLIAGFFAGLALLSGPTWVAGFLTLSLACVAAWFILRRRDPRPVRISSPWPVSKSLLLSAVGTLLLGGTLFFAVPQGLAAGFGALPAYFSGWLTPTGVPVLRLLAALIFYQPLAVVFAIPALLRLRRQTAEDWPLRLFLALWTILAILLSSLYPSRQVYDLAWALPPLLALAAMELAECLPQGEAMDDRTALGQGILILFLVGLAWFTLASQTVEDTSGTAWSGVHLAALTGILALVGLTSVLIILGWGWETGRRGLAWGLTFAGLVYLVSAMSGVAWLRPNQPQELWAPAPGPGQATLLQNTIEDLSEWQTGDQQNADIIAVDLPTVRWLLRNFQKARFASAPNSGGMPSLLITIKSGTTPTMPGAYRGHDFALATEPGWDGAMPPDLIRWFTFRSAPIQQVQVILWARSDVFPGGQGKIQDKNNPQP